MKIGIIKGNHMELYLLRHGESLDDVEDCYGGIADYPLTDGGRQTAMKLAEQLSDSGIKMLFSSPYRRAAETSNIISSKLKCKLEFVGDLRERNSYGVLSGVNKGKAREIFSGVLGQLKDKPGDYYSDELVIGAEPKIEFDRRVKTAVETIIKNASKYDIIGIMTHGNVIRSIYRNILGVNGKVELDLLAITKISYQPATVEIKQKQGIEIK